MGFNRLLQGVKKLSKSLQKVYEKCTRSFQKVSEKFKKLIKKLAGSFAIFLVIDKYESTQKNTN